MKDERRKRKVIDELRFILSIAEIGNVLFVRHIGFGDEMDMRGNVIKHGAQELNDGVRLRKVNAGGADLLPKICDGIETNELRAVLCVHEDEYRRFRAGHRGFES